MGAAGSGRALSDAAATTGACGKRQKNAAESPTPTPTPTTATFHEFDMALGFRPMLQWM
jgi:hypothetical protein